MKKISIIVSVFNTEKYVKKCIDSILNQTYSNLELILVNDGSSDHSADILKEYEKNPKVKIIHNDGNKGLSYSRNVALEASSGDYIGYIDSDDYIDPDYYQNLVTSLEKEKAEIAVCDMKLFFTESNTYQIVSGCSGTPSKINFINTGIAASACNKLFVKKLMETYSFQEGKVNEDLAVVLPLIVHAKKVCYVPNTYYYYVQRNTSIQNSSFSEKRFDIIYGIDLTLKRIHECKDYEQIKDAILFHQIISLLIYKFSEIPDVKERTYFLKRFGELTKKYNIRQNHFFWQFLEGMNKKNLLYYKLLFKWTCEGHAFLASRWISCMLFYKNHFRKAVIPIICNEDLKRVAILNSKLSDSTPKISVVIPNYNYERFLLQRLYSILSQKVKIYEIIILDDCSSDKSIEKIEELSEIISPYVTVKKAYNETNSGSAFKQWEKGFSMALGEYVWICEADDYCDKKLLKYLIKPIMMDSDIRISYSDTAYINADGNIILPSIKPEIDFRGTGHFDDDFISDGMDEIKNYTFLNCTIANVSSSLIKNDDYREFFKESSQYKQAGDWLFYANVMSLGKVSYVNKPLNYYRVHGNNVSSVTRKEDYINELKRIYEYYSKKFGLDKKQIKEIKKRYQILKDAWHLEEKSNKEEN